VESTEAGWQPLNHTLDHYRKQAAFGAGISLDAAGALLTSFLCEAWPRLSKADRASFCSAIAAVETVARTPAAEDAQHAVRQAAALVSRIRANAKAES
jgi:hypothetical protein